MQHYSYKICKRAFLSSSAISILPDVIRSGPQQLNWNFSENFDYFAESRGRAGILNREKGLLGMAMWS